VQSGFWDSTHIPIRKPSVHGDQYINTKGFASVNVQVTCNSRELFTGVDVSWSGSVHDARIWRNLDSYRVIREYTSHKILLANEGYGLAPHCRELGTIERCFGQLKQRFLVLQNKMRLASEQICSIFFCCFVLHNIANCLGDEGFKLFNFCNVLQFKNFYKKKLLCLLCLRN
jgi:hypothetical protein